MKVTSLDAFICKLDINPNSRKATLPAAGGEDGSPGGRQSPSLSRRIAIVLTSAADGCSAAGGNSHTHSLCDLSFHNFGVSLMQIRG